MRPTTTIVVSVISMIVGIFALTDTAQPDSIGSYTQWKTESLSTKRFVIATAVSGIQTGWSFGSAQAQADVGRHLIDEYRRGAIPIRIPGAVGTMRLTNPPRFSHSLKFYVALIDRAYQRFPEYRTTDVPGLLVCFADRPPGKCPPSLTVADVMK